MRKINSKRFMKSSASNYDLVVGFCRLQLIVVDSYRMLRRKWAPLILKVLINIETNVYTNHEN